MLFFFCSDPTNDQIFKIVDNHIDLNTFLQSQEQPFARTRNEKKLTRDLEPFRVSQLIDSCHKNNSIYNVLRLDVIFNIDDIGNFTETYGISAKLDDLLTTLKFNTDQKVWSTQAEEGLNNLAVSELKNFDVDKYLDNVNFFFT